MNLKQYLHNQFSAETRTVTESANVDAITTHVLALIQDDVPVKRRTMAPYAYVFASALLVIALISGISFRANIMRPLIPNVSAQEIVRTMQASISSDRLHYTQVSRVLSSQADTADEIDSLGNTTTSEVWIDRTRRISRLDRIDSKGRVRAMIIKKKMPDGTHMTYQFVTNELNNGSKQGLFVGRADYESYEDNIDTFLKKDFVALMKSNGVDVSPKYEEILYEGKRSYKITLTYPPDKMGTKITSTIVIDKATRLPYEEMLEETGRPDGPFKMETRYSFTTDVTQNIFDLNPPSGYTIATPAEITDFGFMYIFADDKPLDPQIGHKNLWQIERELTVSINNNDIQPRDGMLPVDNTYALYISKSSYSTAPDTNDPSIAYIQVKPHAPKSSLNNIPAQVYTLPLIEDIGNGRYVVIKLEGKDKRGRQYAVKKVFRYDELVAF